MLYENRGESASAMLDTASSAHVPKNDQYRYPPSVYTSHSGNEQFGQRLLQPNSVTHLPEKPQSSTPMRGGTHPPFLGSSSGNVYREKRDSVSSSGSSDPLTSGKPDNPRLAVLSRLRERLDAARPPDVPRNKVYIFGLPENIRKDEIYDFVNPYGRASTVEIKPGYAFVIFEIPESAAACVENMRDVIYKGFKVHTELSTGGEKVVSLTPQRPPCAKCGVVGHFASDCPTKTTANNTQPAPTNQPPVEIIPRQSVQPPVKDSKPIPPFQSSASASGPQRQLNRKDSSQRAEPKLEPRHKPTEPPTQSDKTRQRPNLNPHGVRPATPSKFQLPPRPASPREHSYKDDPDSLRPPPSAPPMADYVRSRSRSLSPIAWQSRHPVIDSYVPPRSPLRSTRYTTPSPPRRAMLDSYHPRSSEPERSSPRDVYRGYRTLTDSWVEPPSPNEHWSSLDGGDYWRSGPSDRGRASSTRPLAYDTWTPRDEPDETEAQPNSRDRYYPNWRRTASPAPSTGSRTSDPATSASRRYRYRSRSPPLLRDSWYPPSRSPPPLRPISTLRPRSPPRRSSSPLWEPGPGASTYRPTVDTYIAPGPSTYRPAVDTYIPPGPQYQPYAPDRLVYDRYAPSPPPRDYDRADRGVSSRGSLSRRP